MYLGLALGANMKTLNTLECNGQWRDIRVMVAKGITWWKFNINVNITDSKLFYILLQTPLPVYTLYSCVVIV